MLSNAFLISFFIFILLKLVFVQIKSLKSHKTSVINSMQNENFTPSKQNLFLELSKYIFKHSNSKRVNIKNQKLALIILKIELKIASIRLKTMSPNLTTHISNYKCIPSEMSY